MSITTGWTIKTVTAPVQEPVTVAQVKSQARIDSDLDDDFIRDVIIPTARNRAEQYLRRRLCLQTVTLACPPLTGEFLIPVGPVVSVDEIRYLDTLGVSQVLDDTTYEVDTVNEPAILRPQFNEYWPNARDVSNAYQITLVVGYEPSAGSPTDYSVNVPPAIRHAILMDCAHLYENRESVTREGALTETPMGWKSLLDQERLLWG